MTTRLTELRIERVALCGDVDSGFGPANSEAMVTLFKMASAPDGSESAYDAPDHKAEEPQPDGGPMPEETIDKAEHDAEVETLTAERDGLQAELDALRADAPTDEIDKSELPESVRKALERGEENERRIAKMEQDARVASFVTLAKSDYANVGPADDLGPALEEIDRTAPDAAKVVTQTLKAANARLEASGVFSELGSGGDGEAGNGAEALIAAEVEKGAARHEAIAKVFQAHPELWQSAE